jgi:hypothetical protein
MVGGGTTWSDSGGGNDLGAERRDMYRWELVDYSFVCMIWVRVEVMNVILYQTPVVEETMTGLGRDSFT